MESFERLYFQWGKPDAIHAVYKQWIKANGSDPDIIAEIGRRFLANGRHRDALPYYQRAAKAGEVMAYRQIAEIHLRQRRDLDMKEALDSYVEASSNKVQALSDALSLYNRSQLIEERVRVLEELVKLQPRNRGYNNQLGQQYIEQGRTSDAFELWRTFLRGSSNPYNELERLARDFSQQGRQDWILMFYEDMIAQEGHDKRIYRLIGNTLAQLSNNRLNGIRAGAATDGLDPAELQKRATHFYERYLTEVSLDTRELSEYASDLSQKQQWELAAKAYAMVIESSNRPERHIILNYGVTLLHIGEMERGEEMLQRYYVELGSQPHHGDTIVGHLIAHQRYLAAEPYLKEMLGSRQRSHVQTAFQRLSEIYRRTDRRAEFLALMEEFLAKSSDPRTARDEILREARNSGMWELEAAQLEIINEGSGSGQQLAELGLALLKSGQIERARATLREHATMANGNEGAQWLQVAALYQGRGMFEDARAAIDSSIASDPDNYRPYVSRANHHLSKGLHDQAEKDFETAIVKAQEDAERASVYMQMIEGYRAVGRHDLATSATRDALKLQRIDRPQLVFMQANAELGDGDHVKARRLLKTLRRDGVPLERVILLARNHGYLEEAAEMIEEELTSGDYVTASALATLHMSVFTTLGGFERLERALQPIFDRHRTERTVEKALGTNLINSGHLERGALYLRAALDSGELGVATVLASTYVRLGAFSDASELYMGELARTPRSARARALSLIATDYMLAGEELELRRLLQHLARDPRHASAAVPLLAGDMARSGGVLAAMSMLRDVASPRRDDLVSSSTLFASNMDDQNAHDAFFLGVVELARAGFPKEARALVLESDPKLQSTARARTMLARLGAHVGDLADTGAVAALLNPSATSTREVVEKLDHARMLISFDQHAPARAAALEHLDSSDNARSYSALSVLARSARITNETELIDGWITRFVEASGDRQAARANAADLLYQLGLDGLVVIGGDGSYRGAQAIAQAYRNQFDRPMRVVGIPATIDNDIHLTDYTIGFDTAVSNTVDALRKIRDTVESHRRAVILEVMGNTSGWIALASGIAGGASTILVPEIASSYDKAAVVDRCVAALRGDYRYFIVVMAEGVRKAVGDEGYGMALARAIEGDPRITRALGHTMSARHNIIGYLARGGTPSAFDNVLAARFGRGAVEALLGERPMPEGCDDAAVALHGRDIVLVSLDDVVSHGPRLVTPDNEIYALSQDLTILADQSF